MLVSYIYIIKKITQILDKFFMNMRTTIIIITLTQFNLPINKSDQN